MWLILLERSVKMKRDTKQNASKRRRLNDWPIYKVVVIGVVVAGLLTTLLFSGVFASMNLNLEDMLYQQEVSLDGNIFILGIDERALENMGPFNTWTRADIADVIDALNVSDDCKPAVIGIDIMYFGNSDSYSDERLVEACARFGNVVSASHVVFGERLETEGASFRMQSGVIGFEVPFEGLRAVTQMGHINAATDSDGYIRHALHRVDFPTDIQAQTGFVMSHSFAFEIYKKYATDFLGQDTLASPPLDKKNTWYIPYSAKPGGYNSDFSVWDLLSGELPPEMFANTIVLIGPYTTGLMDNFNAPIDKSKQMYGVEIHANIIDALLKAVFPIESPPIVSVSVTFALLFGLFLAFYYWNVVVGAALMVAVSVAYVLVARMLVVPQNPEWFVFNLDGTLIRYMLPALYLPLGAFIEFVCVLAVNFITAQRERRQVTETFKKYVDPAIIDDIFTTGLDNLNLGGKHADICVMFVDIRGFTPMSEVMTPEEVVTMLGDYLELTSSAIFKHGGTLDKFIGDATMAFWGAPLPMDDYIYKAVLAAWDIAQAGIAKEDELKQKYGRAVSFGIGLHCGGAVVGNIGTPKRVDYTAIGNTVNTAARLESNAKPAQILISAAVYEAVKDRITARCIGNIPLKGKSEEILVYAVEGIL